MKQTKKLSRKVISYILALVMVFSTMTGIAPGMSITAQAAPAETLLTTITPTGIDTYSESTEGVVNVTLSEIRYYSKGLGWEDGGTVTVTQKEGYTITKCRFNARGRAVDDTEAPFSIDVGSATYVRSVEVYGYANKAAQTITASDVTATYGDTDKSVSASVTTPATGGGAISYTVKDDSVDYIDVASDGKLTIKKVPASGKAYVIVKAAATDDYAETTKEVTVTIAKADPKTPEAFSAIYGQQAKDIPLPTGWSWDEPETKFESSGGVVLTASFEGDANYNQKNNVLIFGTVAKAAAKISYETDEVTKELNSEPFTNLITNTGDATPTFTSSKTSVATVDNEGRVTIKGIGETTITAYVADDTDNYTYEYRKASYKLIVNPVSTVISTAPTAADITYGQKLSKSTFSGGVVNVAGSEETVAGTFAWEQPDFVPNASDSGEYEVVFTPTDTNYAKSTRNVKVKVKKAVAPATKESLLPEQKPAAKNADELVYTGEPIELVTAPTNPLEGYKVQYSKDNGTTWTDTIPTETNVGTYTVKVKYVSDNYENIDLDDITVEITTKEKAAFYAEKEVQKKAADALAADGDSDASKKLIEDAKKAIDELAYDETKSLDENKAALGAIVSKLKDELTDKRAEEKKEADDTAAAKKVTDAINALPASDKVATTDKSAIEAARKAYDALTADQKAKVSAETLKKLEEAEVALEAAEKDEDDQAAADAVAEKINALPASDKVATTDKAAIEAARKAYDALTADQKAKVPADTLKKLEAAEKALAAAEKKATDDAKKSEGKNEWIDGQWYGADGNTEYKAKGSWKQNDKGWWYEDTDGWYPKSQWQMIDGKWYYFTADGYMDYSEYRDGCWLGSDGAWDETYGGGHWMQDSTGWWYVDSTGWYPVNRYLWVDGVQYWFNANGYWE